MENTPFIQFDQVHKRFGSNQVLSGVDLSIEKGCITAIIGKSGTGKSVLLKHIIGLVTADSGQILIDGIPMEEMDRKAKKDFQGRLSYMFQDNALFDFLTVYDNIALPLAEKKLLPSRQIQDKVEGLMEYLGLSPARNRFPGQLSGGMKKRVALARALVVDPAVVLFDEPTTGLDPVRKNDVHEMIRTHQRQFGFTAVIVSHDIPDIFGVAEYAAMLDKGKIIFQGTCKQMQASDNERVADFLQGKEADSANSDIGS